MAKRRDELLGLYLAKLSDKPLLNAEEEIALAKRIESGDQEAEKELYEANLRLVVFIAREHIGKSLNLTFFGLIHEGNLGLFRSVKGFDWRLGNRFSTYASSSIERAIKRAILSDRKATMSLDAQLYAQEDSHSLHDVVADEKSASPQHEIDSNFVSAILANVINRLGPTERKVIRMSSGLGDGIMYRIRDIAKILGVSKSKVKKLKERAIRKMQKDKKINNLK